MKHWEISPRLLAVGLISWLGITNTLVWLVQATGWWPPKIVLFLCLALLPGLACLRVMRIVLGTFSAGLLYGFGISLLALMLSGLAANQVLYLFGVMRPLELWGALGAWDVVTAALIATAIATNRQALRFKFGSHRSLTGAACLLIGLSAFLPFLAALGAFRLNNGGDGLLAEATLGLATALIVYVLLLRRRLPDGVLAWFIFVLGLTILLMTSLRGWDIFGHDIEREFRVYTLTQLNGRWDIGLNRDPYNACLSITILPQMFATLLHVSGLVVFKFIQQVVFAACPVVLYVLLRQYVPKLGALVGSLLFICYPTFINDSAMLTRQGVAYFFFALALLVISNKTQKKRYRRLFLLCALGAVLSHYSTSYMFVALFAIAAALKYGVTWRQHHRHPRLRSRTSRSVLSPLYATLLLLMTFVWYSQITATSGGLFTTLRSSLANIPKLFTEDSSKSSDTSVALLFSGNKSITDLYDGYLKNSPSTSTTPSAVAAAQAYTPSLTSDDLPYTWLGQKMRRIGFNPSLITGLRQNFAKFLQVLALVGVFYAVVVLFRKQRADLGVDALFRKRPDALGIDFVCLSLAGIVLLTFMVALPVLSVNYGLLRAFQQALIFLALPIILLLVQISRRLPPRLRTTGVTVCMVSLFLLFTGLVAQSLGGTSPSVTLNNRGLYFGLYYSPVADARAFAWLKANVPKSGDVRGANFNRARMHDPDYPFSRSDLLPSQLGPTSFVYLDHAQVMAQKFYTYYESSPLILQLPPDYYDAAKNQIYSTTSTRIYR